MSASWPEPTLREQRRGRRIAMGAEERNGFLDSERTCRVASLGSDGSPHVTPLWFVWDGACLWLTSVVHSQRWADLQRDGRVSVIVDAGHDFMELRGVEIRGVAEVVGEVPRTGEPVEELETPERLFGVKYADGRMHHDGRHAWLRIIPQKIVSWDFRKMTG
jgi:Pyridoxamine 5'-phosphate oxidase